MVSAFEQVAQTDITNDANTYFKKASKQYIFEKNIEALRTIEKGLKVYPDNEKLTKLAELILKDSQQQQQQNQQQNQQNQKEEKKEEEKKQQQNKNEEEQKEDKKKQQQTPATISPEDMERLLQAIADDEKDLQKKLKEQEAKSKKVQTEKDW